MTVNALTVSDPLTIQSPTTTGTVTVNGPITGLGNGSVTLTGGTGTTPITLNDGITTAGNAIALNDNVGLGTNVTLDSTNGGGSPAGANIGITGTVNADLALNNRTLNLTGGTAGSVTLSGAVGGTQSLQNLTVTNSNALTIPAITTTGDIQLNAQNAVTLNGAVNAGSGTVTINANSNGAGAESFTMNAGSSITTTDASANAVRINVNATGGGTGAAALRSITTGSGGTLTVATNTGGNTTGGDITQTAGTLLNAGTGTINLTTPAIVGANIGAAATPILTTAGTIAASAGTTRCVYHGERRGEFFCDGERSRPGWADEHDGGADHCRGNLYRLGSDHVGGEHGQYQCPAYEHRSPDVAACDGGRESHRELLVPEQPDRWI